MCVRSKSQEAEENLKLGKGTAARAKHPLNAAKTSSAAAGESGSLARPVARQWFYSDCFYFYFYYLPLHIRPDRSSSEIAAMPWPRRYWH